MTVGLAPTVRFACRVVLEVGHNGPIGHVEQCDWLAVGGRANPDDPSISDQAE